MTHLSSPSHPVYNIGLKCQSPSLFASIDSYTFVAPVQSLEQAQEICDYVIKSCNDDYQILLDTPVTYGRRFQSAIRSVTGVHGGYNPPQDGKPGEVYLQVKGKTLCRVPASEVVEHITYLSYHYAARFTRVDPCVDDYTKTITPEQIEAALHAGNFARFKDYEPKMLGRRGLSRGSLGWTYYFGSRESDRRTRYYNKAVESKGRIDAYRWESQLRDKFAQQFVEMLVTLYLDCPDQVKSFAPDLIAKTVFGSIDFVDRSSGQRLSRCSRLDWWQSFIDKVDGCIRLSRPKVVKTLEKTQNWISKQVSTSLAMIADYYGNSFKTWLNTQIESGRERMTNFHHKIVDVARSENLRPILL